MVRALLLLGLLLPPWASAQPLRVLTSDIKPFFYLEDGVLAGLEYEILLYFAKGRGQELTVRWIGPFEELLPRLERGEGDVVATLTITPERKERFDFSASYFPVRTMLVEPKGKSAAALDDLAGETLVTIPGSVYETILSRVPDAKILHVTTERKMFDLVERGPSPPTRPSPSVI